MISNSWCILFMVIMLKICILTSWYEDIGHICRRRDLYGI
jgi:hypothetical protein